MNKGKDYVKTNIFTGLIALLPISLLVIVVIWLYNFVAGIIRPLAQVYGSPGLVTNILAIITFLIILFLIGLAVRTGPGTWFAHRLDRYILERIPGYKTIKDLIKPFTGKGYKKSFKSVVLVNLYENSALATGFVTDRNAKKGYTTVFVPTGPNPTNGQIVHLKNKYVHEVDISVDKALKTVITVGSGSGQLIEKMIKKN